MLNYAKYKCVFDLYFSIYDDVEPCLQKWKNLGKSICVYSSGSVQAQKLLFGKTEKGNLLPLFSAYFDTNVGQKIESKSYTRIAQKLNCQPKDILFLTDVSKEARAAAEAGLQAVLLSRPGNAPLSSQDYKDFLVISNFNELNVL
uniref:Enolase-phosphatase E1 n=2 Tax=Clastoptera arizonana TaxID=38151 RepID=A0A1B6D196_9HEMI